MNPCQLVQAAALAAGTSGSLDGRSCTAPSGVGVGGRAGRNTANTGDGEGPSHYDTEMEANRLAYVLHLQVLKALSAGLHAKKISRFVHPL